MKLFRDGDGHIVAVGDGWGFAFPCWLEQGMVVVPLGKRERRIAEQMAWQRNRDIRELDAAVWSSDGPWAGPILMHYQREHSRRTDAPNARVWRAVSNLQRSFLARVTSGITRADLNCYSAERLAAGAVPADIEFELECLGHAIAHARKWRRIREIDLPLIDLPMPPEGYHTTSAARMQFPEISGIAYVRRGIARRRLWAITTSKDRKPRDSK